MAPASIGALRDLESLRWLRAAALHSLFSAGALALWCLPSFLKTGLWPFLLSFISASFWAGLLLFLSAQLLFLAALRLVLEPEHLPWINAWGTFELLKSAVLNLVAGAPEDKAKPNKEWAKVSTSAKRLIFVALVTIAATGGVLGFLLLRHGSMRSGGFGGLNFGAIVGFLYAAEVLASQRYVLQFPPIQRPWYLRLKLALRPSASRSLAVALPAITLSEVLHLAHLSLATREGSIFRRALFSVLVGTLIVFCWEMGRSLAQIILTERHQFTPPPDSAAETAPADALVTAIQTSKPLTRHLAFLDLCLVAESSIDTWRHVALFRDDTGDCYKKAIGLCLEPLKGLVGRVVSALGGAGAARVAGIRPGEFQLQRKSVV